ncbi:F-actin-capping protein subunit beta [Ceratobasidium sp. UAMH 11750]|nr:F-actin-capping protein subunit beta [Ceratobasidium sp. UAMH 11750]
MANSLVSRRKTLFRLKRFIFVATAIAAFVLLYASPLSLAPTTWHTVQDHIPPVPDTRFYFNKPPVKSPIAELSSHQAVAGGRLKVTMGGPHPLHGLIHGAEAKWNDMLESQSTTLNEAIEEYQRRYSRRPPLGFDKWYHFARRVGFKLIDEFDQINRDIAPLLALPYHILLRKIAAASAEEHSYTLEIRNGKITLGGKMADWVIATGFEKLVSSFAKDLPDIKIYVFGHDMGPHILSEDMRLAVNTVLSWGQRLTEAQVRKLENVERNPRRGITNACLQDPTTFYASALPERNQHTHTFIRDHRASMSFCTNPAILNNPVKRHGYFVYDFPHPNSASPLFVQCQLSAGGSILHPAMQDYTARSVHAEPVAWANRTEKAFWRGRSTGEAFNHEHDWRFSHRVRLHVLANRGGNYTDPNVTPDVELLVEDPKAGTVHLETHSREVLNERYMDVKMIGPPVQCDQTETDDTCQQMENALEWGEEVGWEVGLDSKFLLDVGM